MKYLKLFNNHEEFCAFTKTCRYVKPNVSVCEADKHVHYDEWHIGDILHADGSVLRCPDRAKRPVGVLVIPADFTDDETYRFMALDCMNSSVFDSTGENRLYPGLAQGYCYPKIDDNGELVTWSPNSATGAYASKGKPEEDQGYTYDFYAGNWYHHYDADPKPYAPAPFLEDGSKNPLYFEPFAPNGKPNTMADMNGYEYTQLLYEFDGQNLPPVKYCKEYAPGFHDGDWYLPTLGEWGFHWYNKYNGLEYQYRRALSAAGKTRHGLAEIWTPNQAGSSTMITYYHTNHDGCFGTHTKTTSNMSTVPFLKKNGYLLPNVFFLLS